MLSDVGSLTGIAGTAGTTGTTGSAVSPRLHTAAVQFESMMLKELMTPLTKSADPDKDGDDSENAAGPLQSFAAEAVAGSMARSGALGFARQIEQSLQGRSAKTSTDGLKS